MKKNKICKICDKEIDDTYNKNRNTHEECKSEQPYKASMKGNPPFSRK